MTRRHRPPASGRSWPRTLSAFNVPDFPQLFFCGVIWNFARWMNFFLVILLATELTDSPLRLQIVGALLFAPFLVGGVVGGVVSDRFDRRLTAVGYLLILTPITAFVAALILTDSIRFWMLYPYSVVAGSSWVVDLTTRRALVADIVGPEFVTNAFSLEAWSSSLGGVVGALAAGAFIGLIGMGEAYLATGILLVIPIALLLSIESPPRTHAAARPWREDLRAGLALPFRLPALLSVLGVTLIMNLFFFPHISLVAQIAEDLGVSSFATGLLNAASMIGSMIATLVIASLHIPRRGLTYVCGALFALALLPVFALAGNYPLAVAALLLGGLGLGAFASMQFTLVVTVAGPSAHGRALGLMTTVIGVVPFGSLLLGVVAESIGIGPAIAVIAGAGIALLVLWTLRKPATVRIS